MSLYSLRHEGNASTRLDSDLPKALKLMNPMPFLAKANPGRAKHWWIRVGTKDSDASLTVVGTLAAKLGNLGDDVDRHVPGRRPRRERGRGRLHQVDRESDRSQGLTRPSATGADPPSPGLGVSVFPS